MGHRVPDLLAHYILLSWMSSLALVQGLKLLATVGLDAPHGQMRKGLGVACEWRSDWICDTEAVARSR